MTEPDQNGPRCARCDGKTRAWDELTEDEREVVNRLPASTKYSDIERRTMHRWCTRCWNESVEREGHRA